MAEYIDRERLKEAFSTDTIHSLQYHDEALFELILMEIDEIPAADVAPVVHGRWEFGHTQGHDWMKCSECLKSQDGWTGVFVYCPNCGAKMDGGAKYGGI